MKKDCFWMVLADNSSETRFRHDTAEKAKTEAKRLAGLNPGVRFFVLQSIGAMVKNDPVSWEDHETDPIPF